MQLLDDKAEIFQESSAIERIGLVLQLYPTKQNLVWISICPTKNPITDSSEAIFLVSPTCPHSLGLSVPHLCAD